MRSDCTAVVAGSACGEAARLYSCGWRCDRHSPWALAGKRSLPKPDPERTAQGLRERKSRIPGLPDVCGHGEDRGPVYCALCRIEAREKE